LGPRRRAPGVSGRFGGRRLRRADGRREQQLSTVASGEREGGERRDRTAGSDGAHVHDTGKGRAMTALTPANQLTLLRMLLIPAFVILVVYEHLGWALIIFVTAGVTDGLDGLI